MSIGSKPRVLFQLAQGHHSADRKTLVALLDGVQPKAGKVDGSANIDGFHLKPDHTAQDAVLLFLVELPCFLQAFRPFVFSDRHHMQVPLFYITAFILSQVPV